MSVSFEDKYKRASLERNRYQPRFDQRITKLPIYLGDEIKVLKEIAEEQKWNLGRYTSSFSYNQSPPLYNSNSFYEFLDECTAPGIVDFILSDINNMPLYVNEECEWRRVIAIWRLRIGK